MGQAGTYMSGHHGCMMWCGMAAGGTRVTWWLVSQGGGQCDVMWQGPVLVVWQRSAGTHVLLECCR